MARVERSCIIISSEGEDVYSMTFYPFLASLKSIIEKFIQNIQLLQSKTSDIKCVP
jgi:hypothetical protein